MRLIRNTGLTLLSLYKYTKGYALLSIILVWYESQQDALFLSLVLFVQRISRFGFVFKPIKGD